MMNLTEKLNLINSYLGSVDTNKVKLAIQLLDTKASEYWKETTYGSWKNFCSKEISLSLSAIYVYTKTIEIAKSIKFTADDMENIVGHIGWGKFRIGVTKVDRENPLSVKNFIEKFKNLNLNEVVKFEDNASNLVEFSFKLPVDVADILTEKLLIRGMRLYNKNRANASAALVKLIKELPESF